VNSIELLARKLSSLQHDPSSYKISQKKETRFFAGIRKYPYFQPFNSYSNFNHVNFYIIVRAGCRSREITRGATIRIITRKCDVTRTRAMIRRPIRRRHELELNEHVRTCYESGGEYRTGLNKIRASIRLVVQF